KLKLIRDTLGLRARRPAAFAGGYEPVPAPEGVCAFVRGGEVLVVVPVRDGVSGTVSASGFEPVPAGRLGVYETMGA
ncbi:MAG: (1-_4)-alpha-D-glucan 1-alpha-D-glucosylmutase, partial [Solirubrobacteraceae bacterium]|nr:(1->4)-alpha-D-glucan 1-alpha-D-glucosylmutase [Solirubrobacteraceae bacterium]